MINLAEVGTDFAEYYGSIKRYATKLRPPFGLIGDYVGNDLLPYSIPLGAHVAVSETVPLSSPLALDWRRLLKRSMLANLIYRIGKVYVPSIRSGLFDQTVTRLSAATN